MYSTNMSPKTPDLRPPLDDLLVRLNEVQLALNTNREATAGFLGLSIDVLKNLYARRTLLNLKIRAKIVAFLEANSTLIAPSKAPPPEVLKPKAPPQAVSPSAPKPPPPPDNALHGGTRQSRKQALDTLVKEKLDEGLSSSEIARKFNLDINKVRHSKTRQGRVRQKEDLASSIRHQAEEFALAWEIAESLAPCRWASIPEQDRAAALRALRALQKMTGRLIKTLTPQPQEEIANGLETNQDQTVRSAHRSQLPTTA